MSVLKVDGVRMSRGGKTVLADIGVTARPGELLAIVGPNGAGKSTLLAIMAGLLKPTAGAVTLDGEALATIPLTARARSLAYLPQASGIAWPLPVRDVIALGRAPYRRAAGVPLSMPDIDAVARAAESVGLLALLDRPATSLSGGERRRVELARALAVEAPVLLADEPTAGLDPGKGLDAMETLRALARDRTIAVVTHDLGLAAQFADRVCVIAEGVVLADGSPNDALCPETMDAAYGVRPFSSSPDLPNGWERGDAPRRG